MATVPTASTPLNHEEDVMAGLIMVGYLTQGNECRFLPSQNNFLSKLPAFNISFLQGLY